MIRGRDLISPLRHLGPHNMLPGAALQLNIEGLLVVFTKSKQYGGELRGVRRTKTKMWLLLAVDYYTSRLECAALEDMTTGSVSNAIQEIVSSNGWQPSKISIDPGLSLITGVEQKNVDVAALQDQDQDQQGQVDDHEGQAVQVIRDLK